MLLLGTDFDFIFSKWIVFAFDAVEIAAGVVVHITKRETSMKLWFIAAAVLLICVDTANAQQLALKETFSQDSRLLVYIANMDQDVAMEYITISDSGIVIYDSRTKQAEYNIPIEEGENIFTNDPSQQLRLRNLMLVQDFNGNGVKDIIIDGVAPEPYIRIVDPKTSEQLLKVATSPQDREVNVVDIDGDNYYELIITAGFTTNIYATQARVATASGVNEDAANGDLAVYPNFPNPVKNGTTLAWELPSISEARVTLHDLNGRAIRNVFRGDASEGVNLCWWDGCDEKGNLVPSGTYRVQIESGGKSADGLIQVVR